MMKYPVLTAIHRYISPDGGTDEEFVFAHYEIGRRGGHDFLIIKLAGGRELHVYPDAVLLFPSEGGEGQYLWELQANPS